MVRTDHRVDELVVFERDDAGRPLPAAAYLVRLRHAGRDAGVRKVVLLP